MKRFCDDIIYFCRMPTLLWLIIFFVGMPASILLDVSLYARPDGRLGVYTLDYFVVFLTGLWIIIAVPISIYHLYKSVFSDQETGYGTSFTIFRLIAVLMLTILSFGFVLCWFGISHDCFVEKPAPGNFGDAVYLSVVTWATVGYGDFAPCGRGSRFVAAYEALSGYLFMAVSISMLQLLASRRE